MSIATGIQRFGRRATKLWNELDYAQRRLFEIRTGIEVDQVQARRRARRTIRELEALYGADEVPAGSSSI
jgi:hypothetical protein